MSDLIEQISTDLDVLWKLSDKMAYSEDSLNQENPDPYDEMLRIEKEREKILQFLPQSQGLDSCLQSHFNHLLELEAINKEFASKRRALLFRYQPDTEPIQAELAALEAKRKARLAAFSTPSLTLEEQKRLLNHLLCHAVNAYFDNILEQTKVSLLTA
jgi:hypothetical protein